MRRIASTGLLAIAVLLVSVAGAKPARAQGGLQKVKHIIVVMQENHSFDNYFGVLAYAPGTPYHSPGRSEHEWFDRDEHGGCREGDHRCVDGLSCLPDATGALHCFNSNIDDDGHLVFAFHDSRRCVLPDLDHGWLGTHKEVNFFEPNDALRDADNNGFLLVNDQTEQLDHGVENPTDDQTMNFYNQDEIPFYYDLAQKFAIDDRYFASLLGPTFPNRSYALAATSFGHVSTSDEFPPPGGYRPITGTIFDLLDKNSVTWADYFQDAPAGASFRPFGAGGVDPHFLPLKLFLAQAAGAPGVPPLSEVSFVDPNFGLLAISLENDEHPPTDIQRGQAYVSQVVNAVRNGPNWADSIILITYDEHGGSYDHVHSPKAQQGHERTPDGISPGQCADLSHPPASLQPGGGAECSSNFLSTTDTTVADAEALCPALTANSAGPYPATCASFDQLGIRVPFIAVSPFSKPHYVSHTTGDHTSILALIEERFLRTGATAGDDHNSDDRQHLTLRDQHASTLEDLFDFDDAPSLNTPVTVALPPTNDCTPVN